MEEKAGGLAAFRRLDALQLKLVAMALMLCDHVWYVFLRDKGFEWMTWLGRLAFPIFAFQIVEGFVHTHSFKRYWKRMFLFALASEIPFNLAVGGTLLYPSHQNVMFSFCIALPLLALIRRSHERGRRACLLTSAACIVLGYLAGYLAMVDYCGEGVLVVLLLYLVRDVRHSRAFQYACYAFYPVHLLILGLLAKLI